MKGWRIDEDGGSTKTEEEMNSTDGFRGETDDIKIHFSFNFYSFDFTFRDDERIKVS